MLSLSKKNILFILFVLTAYLSTSCQKDQIAPANQEVAFVKYYGHVGGQTATDVIETADGGYVMLGSTNSYSNRNETDIFVVKTDSLGNELWSTAFGRAPGNIGDPNFDYVRFSEEGIRIIELPDQSAYVVAANRTYINYPSENSTLGVRGQTKIVLYQLDHATGFPTDQTGIELRSATNNTHTEEVSDMKIDTAGGAYSYVLTGYTTDVLPNKPNDDDNGLFDKTDIFTVLLNQQFGIEWLTSSLASGFPGSDYGTSVEILDIGYLICGTSEEKQVSTSQTSIYVPRIAVVVMEKSGGTPISPDYFGDDGYYFDKAYSVYDATTNTVTIASHVDNDRGINSNKGNIAILQVQPTINEITPVTPNAPAPTYCLYYDLENRTGGGGTENLVASLASVPGNNGYILSSTQVSGLESDICITKFTQDLAIEASWPYHFGYSDQSGLVITSDEAGTILPVLSGTSNQSSVVGYVFAGKFGLGTNEMMGMVRLNLNGTFTP